MKKLLSLLIAVSLTASCAYAGPRRRAVKRPELPTVVHKFNLARLKVEDRLPDRVCVILDDQPKWMSCIEMVRGEVDATIEVRGPAEFKLARMTSFYGEALIRPVVILTELKDKP